MCRGCSHGITEEYIRYTGWREKANTSMKRTEASMLTMANGLEGEVRAKLLSQHKQMVELRKQYNKLQGDVLDLA